MNRTRRRVLKNGAVALTLPTLALRGPNGFASTPASVRTSKRRMVLIGLPLGMHVPFLFPDETGKQLGSSRYLAALAPRQRELLTVVSGLQHPEVDNGHQADASFLTGAPHPGRAGFRNRISIDQVAAEWIGERTRFASLALTLGRGGISYNAGGVRLPADDSPPRLYDKLFLQGSAQQRALQMDRIADGQSILDLVGDQLAAVSKASGKSDAEILDQYATSVRDFEKRLTQREAWVNQPVPKVDLDRPKDPDSMQKVHVRIQQMYDLIFFALQTDSTRLITLAGPGGGEIPSLPGVNHGWHQLSHHGRDPAKIEELAIVEQMQVDLFARFVERLADTPEGDTPEGESNLLAKTVVMMGSSLGNASSHSVKNLPILVAGGPFVSGRHVAFDPDRPPPLCNLYVSFLHHLGIETDRFSSATGTLAGFEV